MNLLFPHPFGRLSSAWLCWAILASTAVVAGASGNSLHPSPQEGELEALQQAAENARTQTDMNIASKDLADYWKRRLTKLEEKIAEALDEEGEKLFRAAQTKWRAFVDAEVILHGDLYRDGTIQPLIRNGVYAALTQKRIADLEKFLKEFRWEGP